MMWQHCGKKLQILGGTTFFGTVMLNHPILNKHLIWYVAQTFSEKGGFLTQTSKKKGEL